MPKRAPKKADDKPKVEKEVKKKKVDKPKKEPVKKKAPVVKKEPEEKEPVKKSLISNKNVREKKVEPEKIGPSKTKRFGEDKYDKISEKAGAEKFREMGQKVQNGTHQWAYYAIETDSGIGYHYYLKKN